MIRLIGVGANDHQNYSGQVSNSFYQKHQIHCKLYDCFLSIFIVWMVSSIVFCLTAFLYCKLFTYFFTLDLVVSPLPTLQKKFCFLSGFKIHHMQNLDK